MNTRRKQRMTPSQQLLEFKRKQIRDHWKLNNKPFGHILPHTIEEYISRKDKFEDGVAEADGVALMDDTNNSLDSYFVSFS